MASALLSNHASVGPLLDTRETLSGLAIVGLGYWGPNWVRNLTELRAARRIVCCDLSAERRARIEELYPNVETTGRLEELLADPEIEGVVVATPVDTHFQLARRCLEADKSVLVEKPLATAQREAAELVRLARERGQVLMVGHTFEYSAPVRKIKEIIEAGELGDILGDKVGIDTTV
jgi:predicted dehydrogenase